VRLNLNVAEEELGQKYIQRGRNTYYVGLTKLPL
jgi:hypothetical protein